MAGVTTNAKITLEEMIRHWAGANIKFITNLSDAERSIGNLALRTFQKSFDLKRFNSSNSTPWPELHRKPRPGHLGLLHETGVLRHSLVKRVYPATTNEHKTKIFTDPELFHGEARNPRSQCFAAIHNSGGGVAKANSPASHIEQRRFMPIEREDAASPSGGGSYGDSSIMIHAFEELHLKIFAGMPQ